MKIIDKIILGDEELVLSVAEGSDSAALAAVERVCFASEPWSEKMFADALENPGCTVYMLYDMQMTKIIAYGVMYSCLDEADLANIATVPEKRGKGIGGGLLDKMLEISRNTGVLRTFLEVRESNVSARALYISRGFTEIGKRRRYYRDPLEDAIIMVREEK
ncbi:MAG: ribosomal-protein-alanine N-acetyltransferase [Ruminococcaceae bacterium]|nr:ribosomal-protein-alanine N-acetyltransferase [Oscillospiraceae bacterium]